MIRTLPETTASTVPFERLPDTQPTLIGLAVSGGGSRAATFASGALEALANLRVREDGREVSVLERVSHVSSVSGGSLASAYYVTQKPARDVAMLAGSGLSPAYQDFFGRFQGDMQRNYQHAAALRQVFTFRALNSTKAAYTFADVWDGLFFHDITFEQLFERERKGDSPRLVLNGTRWNDGRRFVFTTVPLDEFQPNFGARLIETLRASTKIPDDEKDLLESQLRGAYDQFRPVSFQSLAAASSPGIDFRKLNVSIAVASSASVPGVIGPVTFNAISGKAPYHHVGDGGLFDNQGLESLAEIFLHKLAEPTPARPDPRALIIMIDASYPFDAERHQLDEAETALDVLKADPFRVQGMMEQRALAYQLALWSLLRSQGVSFIPDFRHLRIVRLRHTDAKWSGYDELPDTCKVQFKRDVTSEQINRMIATIPTLFRIKEACHGAILIKAAHKVVEQNRARLTGFIEAEAKKP
jgi:predicted acylesterase/phospholipase RssA